LIVEDYKMNQALSLTLLLQLLVVLQLYQETKIHTSYDRAKDLTRVSLAARNLSGEKEQYHRLDFSLSATYSGKLRKKPAAVNFELFTIVKARKLNSDLYVEFVRDGEAVHFGSNREAVMKPVPGRSWIGERMVFLVPYDDFLKLTEAQQLEIRLGGVRFEFDDTALNSLRSFLEAIK